MRKQLTTDATTTIVPDNSGENTSPLSIRFPDDLLRRIDACAAATGNKRSRPVVYLCAWAVDQWEKQQATTRSNGR